MLGIVVENNLQVYLTLPLVVEAHISPPECSFEVCVARLKLLLRPEPTAMVGVALGLLPLQELRHMDLKDMDFGRNGVNPRQGPKLKLKSRSTLLKKGLRVRVEVSPYKKSQDQKIKSKLQIPGLVLVN